MEETTGQPPETTEQPADGARVFDCLKTVWNNRAVKILRLVLFPLGLYLSDFVTDLLLALQYYYSGDSYWFGWTLGFVLGPLVIINIISAVFMSEFDKDSKPRRYVQYLMHFLQLAVVLQYFDCFRLLLRGQKLEHSKKEKLSYLHMFEAMFESIPQLCLQLYIIVSTHGQVSVLKVIAMVISLLAALWAVGTCWYHFIFKKKDRTFNSTLVKSLIVLIIWKAIELSVRVLAIALFASAFKPWIALPIGVHWLIMTIMFTCISIRDDVGDENAPFLGRIIISGLLMAVDTFSMTFSFQFSGRFRVNTVLTLLGNVTMVTVWYTLKAGQVWYDVPAVAVVVAGSLGSAILGVLFKYKIYKQ